MGVLDPVAAATTLQAGEALEVTVDGQVISLSGEDVLVQTEPLGGLAVAGGKGVTVAVDPHLTPELVQEGYARDLVRAVNGMRKDAGFDISDRIELGVAADDAIAAALERFGDFIQQETLAVRLSGTTLEDSDYEKSVDVGDMSVHVSLRKV